VEAIDLVKRFGDNVAVDHVSFEVPEGTVLGLLGPNGAGKTTTVRMLTTLSVPTSGTARWLHIQSHCHVVNQVRLVLS
jgi:ABC-2 type transport system ATP-binding protein